MSATLESTTVFSETQYVVAEPKPALTVRYHIAPRREDDKVYLSDGLGFFFSEWLRATERAVKDCIEYNDATALTKTQIFEWSRSAKWLWRCGVRFDDRVALIQLRDETLPLLRLPADSPSMTRRCARCGRPISGRESIIYGIGTECRKKAR